MSMIDPRGEGGGGAARGGGGNATHWCALCGTEYRGAVAECADCHVPLVDHPPLNVDDVGDEQGEQIAYEYDDLDEEGRFVIDRVLADAGIVHAWEGASLVVAPYDSEEVDRLLDAAADLDEHGGDDVDDALLEEGAEQLVYDLEDWDAERRADLDGRLEAEGIAHAFDETGDLVVLESEEERVDRIIDEIDFPDQLEADTSDGAGGLDAVEALGSLYVATDRLVHDPSDTEGTLAAVESSQAIADMHTPFGFGPETWEDLVEKAGALRSLLETDAEVVDDDAVHDAAESLRAALRPYV